MPTRLTYFQARILLLLLGAGVAIGITILAYERGAAATEVLAPALYLPVFAGGIFWGLPGGLGAAALASTVYGVLLADQVSIVGLREFTLLLITRVATYALFGFIVPIGVRYIEGRLRKLEIYDQIDDATGIYNSSFFLQDTDLETGRANRYQTFFSVVGLDLDRTAFEGFSRRRYQRTIRELAQRIEGAIRQVDRPARVAEDGRDRFLVILPQTAGEGARVFADRLEEASRDFLADRGAAVDGRLEMIALTYPDEPDVLARVRDEVAQVEAVRRAVRDEG